MYSEIKFELIGNYAEPTRAHETDQGYDVRTNRIIRLMPNDRLKVPLCIKLEMPNNIFCLVQGKSGLANTKGITTIGNVIDSGYRGEINCILLNTSNEEVVFQPNDKIAQLVFLPVVITRLTKVIKINEESDRGNNGFGSTGN